MIDRFEELIEGFLNHKVGVSTQFLSTELTNALSENLRILHHEGQMISAGVGDAQNRTLDKTIRRDKIYWMDNATANIAEREFLSVIDEFVSYLNRTCFTAINDYEFHYAVYEAGSFYKRHIDQFRNNNFRKFSLITYLNEDWKEEDGGSLLLYRDNGIVDSILPTAQRAVFFKSDEMEHEVAVATRARMSITGWLKSV